MTRLGDIFVRLGPLLPLAFLLLLGEPGLAGICAAEAALHDPASIALQDSGSSPLR